MLKMKLSQMFTGQTQAGEAMRREEAHFQQTVRNTAAINRQIRSLVPGQTISGEIVGRNGGEVQIKLADDLVLNARVDRSLNIELGKNMTFEVKNNGSALTLSPLFTNVATDVNVLKALDMAGLPVNRASVELAEKLMEAGLSVSKNSLMQAYREINSFPQAQISDVVDLHRLQMPVNEANLNQMAAYRNLTHQLLQGMNAVSEALPEVIGSLNAAGDAAGAVKLYQELFMLIQEGSQEASVPSGAMGLPLGDAVLQELAAEGEAAQDSAVQDGMQDAPGQGSVSQEVAPGQENVDAANGQAQRPGMDFIPEGPDAGQPQAGGAALAGEGQPTAVPGQTEAAQTTIASEQAGEGQAAAGAAQREGVPEALRAAVSEEVLSMVKELPLTEQQMAEAVSQVNRFAAGETDAAQFLRAMNQLAEDAGSLQHMAQAGQNDAAGHNEAALITDSHDKAMRVLANMFSQPSFKKLLNGQLKKMWTVSPREVAEAGKVEELYRRLDRQLKGLTNALENAGQSDSAAYKAASSMSQNVDFLQQINQMYAYVQLPLRLQQSEAHGELYVYTNKKHMARADGKVSALLHLDMEYLGPVDVYVTLQDSKVNTNFRVRDDEMLDFLSQHMDLLTERLKKRGYDCSYSMTTKGDAGDAASGIAPVLQQEKGIALAQYAFDVRT